MDPAALWFLGISTVVTVFVLLAGAVAQLRDEIVAQGWISRDSVLGRMTQRAQMARAEALVKALGITDAEVEDIRALRARRRMSKLGEEVTHRPDKALLRRVKRWVYELDPPYNYRGSGYYLDMMGAFYQRNDHEPSLAQIHVSWLLALTRHDKIRPFDLLLTTKDGNPLLAFAVARALQKPLIVCKGEVDKSLVDRPDVDAPHETDFEGLRAFLDAERKRGNPPSRKYRVVVIDDSCAGGSNIISAATRFNRLVHAAALPFHDVVDVAVLFRVKGPDVTDAKLNNASLKLHALIAVGAAELKLIHHSDPETIAREAVRYKDDSIACADSAALYRD
ncbi:MAG: hypothetical protein ACM30G_13180 [Micromonosporaceae bacterium]